MKDEERGPLSLQQKRNKTKQTSKNTIFHYESGQVGVFCEAGARLSKAPESFRARTFGLGQGGGGFLARKIYAISECVIVEIGIRTHSNCTINHAVHNFSTSPETVWYTPRVHFTRGNYVSRISCKLI